MTQVIACALQLGGMPVPKGGGVVLVDGLAGIVRDAGGEVRTGADVERVLVSGGKATAVRLAGGETIRAERAVVASVTPTQLYGQLLGAGEAPDRRHAPRPSISLRTRGDADPPRDERAAGLVRRRAPCADRDRARHTGARRRLARGERSRARTPPRRGDDRLRPADGGRSVARARGLVDHLDPAAGASCRTGQGRCRRTSSTSATAAGRRSSARRTPTGSPRVSAATSRTSSGRRSQRVVALSRRHRGAERQPRRRRHLRRLVRPRPELPLPPAAAGARTPHSRRRPLAHRSVDAPGPGPRRGLRLPRLQGAHEARAPATAALAACRWPDNACNSLLQSRREALAVGDLDRRTPRSRRTSPRTPPQDSTGSASGSSSCRDDDAANVALVREAGLGVASCVPTVPSILPLRTPGHGGPAGRASAVSTRSARACAGLPPYEPECVLVLHRAEPRRRLPRGS